MIQNTEKCWWVAYSFLFIPY